MINTVTLNPSIDRIFFIKEFKRNVTSRIQNTKACPERMRGSRPVPP